MIGRLRDRLGSELIAFAMRHVCTSQTGARHELAMRKGHGIPISEDLQRRANAARQPGQ